MEPEDGPSLRDEVTRLLAAALESDSRHVDEMHRRDELHIREVDPRDTLHHDEMQRRTDRHDDELENIKVALDNCDLIGQAKGVLMATLGVSADRAFALIKSQSQHENRKVVEIAGELAQRAAQRQPPGPPTAPQG